MENLEQLGYSAHFTAYIQENNLQHLTPGRVVRQDRDRYLVATLSGTLEAEVTGNLRFSAFSAADLPVVGDWVALQPFDGLGIIQRLLPRKTLMARKASGSVADLQPLAANLDFAFLVMGLGKDFNLNRMERYLALVHGSGVKPIIILSKADLFSPEEQNSFLEKAKKRLPNGEETIMTSTVTGMGISHLEKMVQGHKTCCLLGSSGVGKSTLLNALAGDHLASTGEVSRANQKGKHTTTNRELILLDNGGILIDTPGMRELGLTGGQDGIRQVFSQIEMLASKCRFPDCTHQHEPGCAVLEALDEGLLDESHYQNYLKLQRESVRFGQSEAEKRKASKAQGKVYREMKAFKKKHKR